jgi:SulP family sulfate permease
MVDRRSLVDNLLSGITVAFVALPLNLALALACGMPASAGLVTAAVAGTIGALFGGSRLQITGPEVALVPLTYEISQRYGLDGLLCATFLCGLFQIAFGLFGLGRLIHAIPVSVIGGFMAAVGILVFDAQLPRFLGLPADVRLLTSLRGAAWLSKVDLVAVALGVAVIAALVLLPRLHRRLPAGLLGLALVMVAVTLFGLRPASVGAIEPTWPALRLPAFGRVDMVAILPEAITLALLASIDSLLSAVAVDAQTKAPRHSSEQELLAQGLANIACSLVGGMPAAGAIVRSTAAVKSGASTRLTGLTQSVVLLGIFFLAAPLVARLPLAGLAGILLFVGAQLVNVRQLVFMWKVSRFEAIVFVATALSILFADFVDGVMVGLVLALVHFAHVQRRLDVSWRSPEMDEPGEVSRLMPAEQGVEDARKAAVIRLEGPIFFASHTALERLSLSTKLPEHIVFDLSGVPLIDYTGVEAFSALVERLRAQNVKPLVARASAQVAARLEGANMLRNLDGSRIFATIAEAMEHAGAIAAAPAPESRAPRPPSPPMLLPIGREPAT